MLSAGAGSGKTYTLTGRMVELLKNGVRPAGIMATTFTQKAAAELQERVRVRLLEAHALQAALDGELPTTVAVYARSSVHAPPTVFVQPMPEAAAATAHELFAMLRALDARGVKEIWVETPPSECGWDGVRDRLQRAAA